MSNILITVTAYGVATIQDLLGIEAYAKPGTWISTSTAWGLVVSFEVPGNVWTRIRPQLNALAQRRIPAMDSLGVALGTGKTQPLLKYTADWVPGDRPRVHQVEGCPLSLAAPGNLTLRGTNLLGALAASSTIQSWDPRWVYALPGSKSFAKPTDVLKFTALAKGPIGNKIAYSIEKEAAAASVAVTLNADGDVYVKITPLAGASNSTAIAAQVAGSPAASVFMSATALIASQPVGPTQTTQFDGSSPGGITPSQSGQVNKVYLSGGDGGGLAILDVPVVAGVVTNRLHITSNKSGNDQNLITVTLLTGQVADAVAVVGNDITVSYIAATKAIGTIATDINADPAAAALVTATAVGAGSLAGFSKTWLYGGAGEPPTVTIMGATSSVISQTDTTMVIATTNAALVAAGALAGEEGLIQMQMNYGLVSASIGLLGA